MLRAVLSIVGILATIAVLMWCFGITVPQITSLTPGLNRSVMRTVGLMQGAVTEKGREPAGAAAGGDNGPATAPQNSPAATPDNAPSPTPDATPGQAPAPSPGRSDSPEIIGPDSTAHLNPAHTHDVDQPGSPNPPAFVAPNPLPAQPHWTWDVGNREFTNVVITRVDADLVTIASDSGAAQIDIALLPQEIQRELNYDSSLANQAAAARKAAAH